MSLEATIVKFMMNLLPKKPEYQEKHFVQEIFRHSNYTSLSKNEKRLLINRLIKNHINESKNKQYDLYYPSYPLKKVLNGRKVLDLGCGIGGKTIHQGEYWGVSEICGIDVNPLLIDSTNHFLRTYKTEINYNFVQGYAEKMPFEDSSFDAIISEDTIEHVRSVKETLTECKRVLRKGGIAFLSFPSIRHPIGGAHVRSATRMLFLEWFFSTRAINDAYHEIIKNWGDDLNWYKPLEETKGKWAVAKAGIGVNGTKYKDFMLAAEEVSFSKISFVKIPLLSVSTSLYLFILFMHLRRTLF